MRKKEYLTGAVEAFANWFGQQLTNSRIKQTYSPYEAESRSFSGLEDAFSQYHWEFCVRLPGEAGEIRGHTFEDNELALNRLRTGLMESISMRDDITQDRKTCEWSVAVMGWGSARPHNEQWLVKNRNGLCLQLLQGVSVVAGEDDGIERIAPYLKRFNAGMSKLYSLLVPGSVIYDSRVAGALAWFVARWCMETNRARIPGTLAFPCLTIKESYDPKIPKIRNPSRGSFKFPTLRYDPAVFARWNLRASWTLQAALERAGSSRFKDAESPLRALQAALFMWGYDLRPLMRG